MDGDSRLTAYCGLYCKDCIPSHKELYSTAARLQTLLEKLQFDQYAELKACQTYWSEANRAFQHYPQFVEVLQAMRNLECTSLCRDGGGWKGERCEVRNCAIEKGLEGCWECSGYKNCEKLAPLLKFHPNLQHHLGLIKKEGINNWSSKRKAHYPWL